MIWPTRMAATIAMIAGFATIAGADQWNDRTILKFDAPMMIPGATLAPGTYTFRLLDSQSNRHVVQVFKEKGTDLVATTQAIPAKRMEPTDDVVLKLNPTEAGAPAAIKAWFYPGSVYGHEFIYPDEQARQIAQRTKTLVLSGDVADGDMRTGTLHTYDAEGRKGEWRPDVVMLKDWERWSADGRAASARVAAPGTADTRQSTAPMMRAQPEGMKVSLADLEEKPNDYVGKTISVSAEVENVFGPRLFKIDEPNWADLDGEVLVFLPGNLAALVREDDRVTVTGTMKMFIQAELERELAWLEPDPDIEVEFARRPVLVASQVIGGNSNVALAIDLTPGAAGEKPVGTAGSTTGTTGSPAGANTGPVNDAETLGKGADELVGRQVKLDQAQVSRVAKAHGFWIQAAGTMVFVLPQHAEAQKGIAAGQTASIQGVVLQMPRSMREKTRGVQQGNDEIYIYATAVKK